MRDESGGYSGVYGGIWGILSVVSLALPLANMVFALMDYLTIHRWLYFLLTEMICIFVLAIAWSMRDRIEAYYFPERGYAPAEASWLMNKALAIWPIVLVGALCLVMYLYFLADIAQYAQSKRADVPADAVQSSVLLLVPYVIFFGSVSATCALIGLKEYVRASPQLLSEMMEEEGTGGGRPGVDEGL